MQRTAFCELIKSKTIKLEYQSLEFLIQLENTYQKYSHLLNANAHREYWIFCRKIVTLYNKKVENHHNHHRINNPPQ